MLQNFFFFTGLSLILEVTLEIEIENNIERKIEILFHYYRLYTFPTCQSLLHCSYKFSLKKRRNK